MGLTLKGRQDKTHVCEHEHIVKEERWGGIMLMCVKGTTGINSRLTALPAPEKN